MLRKQKLVVAGEGLGELNNIGKYCTPYALPRDSQAILEYKDWKKKKKNTKTGKSSAVKSLNLTLLGFKIKETLTYMYNSVENTWRNVYPHSRNRIDSYLDVAAKEIKSGER